MLLCLLFFLTACADRSEPVLVFSAIPDEDATRLQERFNKVADYLERQLGVPVEYVPVTSYAAAVTAFRNNQVQLAWLGGCPACRPAARHGRKGPELLETFPCSRFVPAKNSDYAPIRETGREIGLLDE